MIKHNSQQFLFIGLLVFCQMVVIKIVLIVIMPVQFCRIRLKSVLIVLTMTQQMFIQNNTHHNKSRILSQGFDAKSHPVVRELCAKMPRQVVVLVSV